MIGFAAKHAVAAARAMAVAAVVVAAAVWAQGTTGRLDSIADRLDSIERTQADLHDLLNEQGEATGQRLEEIAGTVAVLARLVDAQAAAIENGASTDDLADVQARIEECLAELAGTVDRLADDTSGIESEVDRLSDAVEALAAAAPPATTVVPAPPASTLVTPASGSVAVTTVAPAAPSVTVATSTPTSTSTSTPTPTSAVRTIPSHPNGDQDG